MFFPVFSGVWGWRCRLNRIRAQPRCPTRCPSDGPRMLRFGSVRRWALCASPHPIWGRYSIHPIVNLSVSSTLGRAPCARGMLRSPLRSARTSAVRSDHAVAELSALRCSQRGLRGRIALLSGAAGQRAPAARLLGVWGCRGCRAAHFHLLKASMRRCSAGCAARPYWGLFQQHPKHSAAIKYLALDHSFRRGSHTPGVWGFAAASGRWHWGGLGGGGGLVWPLL